jgi:hypothetical protein
MTADGATLVRDVLDFLEKVLIGVFSLTGAYLAHRFSRERERERLIQEKAERLVTEIYALEDWVGHAWNKALVGEIHTSGSRDSIGQVATLVELYFPALREECSALMNSIDITLSSLNDRQALPNKQEWYRLYGEHLNVSKRCVKAVSQHMAKTNRV